MRLPALRLPAPALRLPALAALLLLILTPILLRRSIGGPTTSRVATTASVGELLGRRVDYPKAMPAPPPMASPVRAMEMRDMAAEGAPGIVETGAASAPEMSAAQLPGTAAAASADATSMVIRTGAATIQVDSLETAMARVRAVAAQVGGFVASSSIAAGREQVRSATLEIKVPAARFDELVSALAPVGRVETVNVSAEDVGEEFVDVSARVANARRLEERLVSLLATRAGRLTDVLAVERELARVREEIERYDGRMRWIKAHAAVSTLTVNVHEPPPIVGRSPAATPVTDAFRQAWRNCVGVIAWLIAASGVVVPLGTLALLAWPLVAAWRRRPVKGDDAAPAV